MENAHLYFKTIGLCRHGRRLAICHFVVEAVSLLRSNKSYFKLNI